MRYLLPVAVLALGLALAACDSTTTIDPVEPLEVTRVENLPADPPTGRDPQTGQPTGTTGRFTLYNLREGRVVLDNTNANRADSASAAWDIGFRSTTIIFNSGVSGPGNAAAQIVVAPFDEVTEAPADGYRQDAAGNQFAIPTGAGNGWFERILFQGGPAGYISPIPGRTIVVRTADGRYAKLRILSYYRDQPEPPINPVTANDRYYTFEYVFQPDGSRSFAD